MTHLNPILRGITASSLIRCATSISPLGRARRKNFDQLLERCLPAIPCERCEKADRIPEAALMKMAQQLQCSRPTVFFTVLADASFLYYHKPQPQSVPVMTARREASLASVKCFSLINIDALARLLVRPLRLQSFSPTMMLAITTCMDIPLPVQKDQSEWGSSSRTPAGDATQGAGRLWLK